MNQQPPTGHLPELSEESIDRMERGVFEAIARGKPQRTARANRATRRRRWLTGAGVAAAFAAGVLVTPPILSSVTGGAVSVSSDGAQPFSTTQSESAGSAEDAVSPDSAGGAPGTVTPELDSAESAPIEGAESAPTAVDEAAREIVANADATVQVDDIAAAAARISAIAEERGGYVESTNTGSSQTSIDETQPRAPREDYGWISIRVPSEELTEVIAELDDAGEVLSSSISKQDVTAAAIDLRARIDAARASVERLTELMSQSGTVSELIEAEVALTDRQAQLESYEQQLASLEDQVALSSLHVQLTLQATATADPAGFGDGLLAGWNGLIVSLNALVIAVGFLLPWLGIAAIVVLLIWAIRRARRRSRGGRQATQRSAEG